MKRITLYDETSIHNLPFPKTDDGQYARNFLIPFLSEQPNYYIQNANTKMLVLTIDQLIMPICINESEYNNTYVCSPYTHYIRYAKQELYLLKSKVLRLCLAGLLNGLSPLFKMSKVNKTVHVNNWLLSTNLYPNITDEQVRIITSFLQKEYPKHTILFRSINKVHHQNLFNAFVNERYKLIASRQVYIVHPTEHPIKAKPRWLLKRDQRLFEKHGYKIVKGNELRDEDIPRILELYNVLYLHKYSKYNPQLTEDFIYLAIKNQTLTLNAIKKDGQIDAVLGYFCRNGVMTTPLFGYDLTVPMNVGLYRMLSVRLYHIALENGHSLNESSGAAQFKRNRGAVGAIEYTAVYDAHLPFYRRWIWSALRTVTNHIGVPLIRKYKL